MTKTLISTAIVSAFTVLASAVIAHPDSNHSGNAEKPSAKQAVRAMDTDGDGLINFEEFELPQRRPARTGSRQLISTVTEISAALKWRLSWLSI